MPDGHIQIVAKMSKVVQIALLAKISGNVNADESIGTRITLKKMYNAEGEVLPFVSARAIKHSIRKALEDKGYQIDPFVKDGQQLNDSGDSEKYVDNDLFGYMATRKGDKRGAGGSDNRQAPVALSYLKAIYDTPVSTEFAARFPRSEGQDNPVPFEIEVAEFVGRLNTIIYDYVGKKGQGKTERDFRLSDDERKRRLKDFLEIFLSPSYVLPRRTNSLNIPEYLAGLIVFSTKGPKPIYQYLDYQIEKKSLILKEPELKQLGELVGDAKFFLIDYGKTVYPSSFESKKVKESIKTILDFYFGN